MRLRDHRLSQRPHLRIAVSFALAAAGLAWIGSAAHASSTLQPAAGQFVAVTPSRILSTSSGLGVASSGALASGTSTDVTVDGAGGIPSSGVAAVWLSLTAVAPTAAEQLTVYAAGTTLPSTTSMAAPSGSTVTQGLLAPVGSNGKVSIYGTGGSVQLLGDVTGYYLAAGSSGAGANYVPVTGTRIVDTTAGVGAPHAQVANGGTLTFSATGVAGIPTSNVAAVAFNITAGNTATGSGSLTAFQAGTTRPSTTTVSTTSGVTETVPAQMTVSTAGQISLYNSGPATDVYIDVTGYYQAPTGTAGGGTYVPLTPTRVVDTTSGLGAPHAPLTSSTTITSTFTGVAGVPSGAAAVAVSVTALSPTAATLLDVYQAGTSTPNIISAYTMASTRTTTLVPISLLSSAGQATFAIAAGSTDITADVVGYWKGYVAPSAPTSVTATPGTGQATVSWTAPADGGSAITGYTVTSSPGSFTATTTGATTATVTGLTNGTSYTFTVKATNAAGTGTASSASSAVVPANLPGAPTAVHGTSGNGQVSVSWTAPSSNGGSAITGYTVTSSPGSFTATTTGATTGTVTGLTNGTSYTFTVKATNAVGTGTASTASAAVIPVGPPGAPTAVSGTRGNGQVSVSWTAPSSNGGSAITGYTVTSSPGSFTATTTGATTANVTGLTNGTSYTFAVTASNTTGTGTASAPSAAVTPATVPGAPTAVTATPGTTQATVSWTAPASSGGSAITGYTVTSSPGSFTATTTGATTATVTGLTNGTSYTFTVKATNAVGTGAASTASSAVVPANVPGAPTSVSATAGVGQATVTWTAPSSNGGSAITGYTVTSSGGQTASTTGATTATVTGLTGGTSYTFTVKATNAIGSSTSSAASSAVTPTGAPGAPTGVAAVAGNTQATVSWTAPTNNGGSAITGYTVSSSGGQTASTTGATTATVTGLTNGTSYTFTVKATNTVGSSAASASSGAVTPATTPGAPTSVTATAGNTQAVVSWTAPTSNGGNAITGYTVTSSPGGLIATTTGSTSATVTGLTNGTSYTFTVTASNSLGSGAASAASPAVTPSSVPGSPTSVAAVAGDSQAVVSWTAPTSNGGSAITGYTVTSSPGGLSATTTGATSATVTGLTDGTSYTFTVTATNATGTSPASTPSGAVTPAGPPSAPTSVTATFGNRQVTVSWTAPTSNGGSPITGYTVTSSGGQTASTTGATTATVTGLANGTAYTFTVTSSNSTGTSSASAASAAVTPAGPPDPPTGPSGAAGDSQATIAWFAPANTGGSPITSYTVTASPGGAHATTTATSAAVTGLTNFTTYTFTVTATNAAGTSVASAASGPVTPKPQAAYWGGTSGQIQANSVIERGNSQTDYYFNLHDTQNTVPTTPIVPNGSVDGVRGQWAIRCLSATTNKIYVIQSDPIEQQSANVNIIVEAECDDGTYDEPLSVVWTISQGDVVSNCTSGDPRGCTNRAWVDMPGAYWAELNPAADYQLGPGFPVGQLAGGSGSIHNGVRAGSSVCSCPTILDANNPSAMSADPVNTTRGTQVGQYQDINLPGVGIPFTLTRTYDSQTTGHYSQSFGTGWSSLLDIHLDIPPTEATQHGDLTVHAEDGQSASYTYDNGSFDAPPGVYSTLAAAGSGYVLTTKQQHRITFDSMGNVLSYTDKNGYGLTFGYTAGQLSSVTDSAGRVIVVNWTGDRVSSIALPDGRSVSYTYTNDMLTSVTDLAGKVWTYTYDSYDDLTSVIDPNGHHQFTDTYWNSGTDVATQTDGNGNVTTFTHFSSFFLNVETLPNGAQYWDDYSGQAASIHCSPTDCGYYTYDSNGNLTQDIDGDGTTTNYTYDSRGNRLSQSTSGGGLTKTESWTYDADNNVLTHTDVRGETTTNTYDSSDRLLSTTDPSGAVTTYTYGVDNEIASSTDGNNHTTSYGYDPAGDRTSITSPLGQVTTMAYDSDGRLTGITDPRGNVAGATPTAFTTTFSYDNADHLNRVTPPSGNATIYTFDDLGNEDSETDGDGQTTSRTYYPNNQLDTVVTPKFGGGTATTTYAYDNVGDLTSVTDPNGQETSYTYDQNLNLPLTKTSPLGNVAGASAATIAAYTTTYTYNYGSGKLLTASTPNPAGGAALVTTYGYDGLNRQTSVTDPNGHQSTTAYDLADNVTGQTDANNHTTSQSYDADGRLATTTDGNGHTTSYTYDGDGNLATTTTALGEETTYGYDADNRLTSIVDPRGNVTGGTPLAYTTTYGYDPAGDRTSSNDPNGHTTSWTYDGDRNQTSETDADGRTTSWTYTDRDQIHTVQGPDATNTQLTTYVYDPAGDETSATDPNGHTTSWTYDASNRLTTATDPLSRSYTYSYDLDDNLTTEVTPQEAVSPGHGTITSSYDALDRLTSTSYSDGTPSQSFGYDNDGQLTSNSNGTATDALTYDPAGQLTQLVRTPTTGVTQTFTYGYDNAGNITSRTRPAGGTLTYTYDADNQPLTVVDGTQTSTATYDPDGDLTSLTQPTSPTATVQNWTYDHADQLSGITSTQGNSTLASYGLTRDPVGNITAQTATISGATTNTGYAYDPANRISEICPATTSCTSPASSTTSISYDKVGNRTGATITGTGGGTLSYSYDAANELTTAVNSVTGTTNYAYNALGEQTTAGSLASTYDLAGQLTSTAIGGITTTYGYDPEGNRLTANASGGSNAGTTTYALDPNTGDSNLPDLAAEQLPSGQINDYDWLTPVLPVSQTRTPASGSSTSDYYLTDPQHSVSELLNASGAVTGTYAYDPFGNGTNTTGTDSGGNPLRWTSAYQDPTGQYNNRAREYDPSQSLFTSTDPLTADSAKPTASTYLYAQQNPLNGWDPTGQSTIGNTLGSIASSLGSAAQDVIDPLQGVANSVNSFRHCLSSSSAVDCAVMTFDPAYQAVEGYVNEWRDTENGCPIGTIIGDGLEAVGGVAGTGAIAIGGADRIGRITTPKRVVIGKLDDLQAPGAIRRGEKSLLKQLPDLKDDAANWAQNERVLLDEMKSGNPIRDASVDPATGALQKNTGFLARERGVLIRNGWTYNPGTHLWSPPGG